LLPSDLQDEKDCIEIEDGQILVDEALRTNLSDVYAGGDCINAGKLTVISVEDGKLAAESIHRFLTEHRKSKEQAYG